MDYEVTLDIALVGTDRSLTKSVVCTVQATTLAEAVKKAEATAVLVTATAARVKPVVP